ncbi:uncharacterized protein TNCV_3667901 [Trichonephila clavipes]|nr:uncharacterized protein TNCV_3667901 [Trichonephila clavipes]
MVSLKKLHEGFLATGHVILNHGQVTWTTPELAPPLLTTTPHQREDVSVLDRFNVHRCPTRRVFSGTGLELVTRHATVRYLYHSATAATSHYYIGSLEQFVSCPGNTTEQTVKRGFTRTDFVQTANSLKPHENRMDFKWPEVKRAKALRSFLLLSNFEVVPGLSLRYYVSADGCLQVISIEAFFSIIRSRSNDPHLSEG